jgi:hypothetical protein
MIANFHMNQARQHLRRAALRNAAIAVFFAACATHVPMVTASEIGRLFFDPQERAELDRRRAQPPRMVAPAPIGAAPIAASPAKAVTLNGFVTQSGGRSTIWINNEAAHGSQGVTTSAPLPVPIGEAGRRIELKVGQSYDDKKGRSDPLAGGRIEVNR